MSAVQRALAGIGKRRRISFEVNDPPTMLDIVAGWRDLPALVGVLVQFPFPGGVPAVRWRSRSFIWAGPLTETARAPHRAARELRARFPAGPPARAGCCCPGRLAAGQLAR